MKTPEGKSKADLQTEDRITINQIDLKKHTARERNKRGKRAISSTRKNYPKTHISKMKMAGDADKQAILGELENAVKNLQEEDAIEAAKKSLAAGVDPVEAIENGLAKGIREVGEKFARKEMFVVELIYAAEIMGGAIKVLEPEMKRAASKRNVIAQVVIGTVAGDIHDIGKNLVKIMLEAGGFEVHDLGKDAANDLFVEKAKEVAAGIVGASSLMTTTVGMQKEVVDALRAAGVEAPVMVGGAAVTEEWAKEIGATYSSDAGTAVDTAKELAGKGA